MFQWDDIIIPCPVDLRRFNADASNSICNLTGNYYCRIKFNKNGTFEEICREISAQMHIQKNNSFCLKEPLLLHILDHGLPPSIVKEILSIPETWNPRLALALGYPSHKSSLVELPENGSIKYYLDEERQYYVPKRKQEDISIIR